MHMESFCSQEELELREKQYRQLRLLFGILCGLTVLALIIQCLLTRTENAALMLRIASVSMVVMGWACIAFYLCVLVPRRNRIAHLKSLLSGEKVIREGTFYLDGAPFRIPKSVRVHPVRLECEKETARLNLEEEQIRLAPPDGTPVRVLTVRKFIVGIESLSGEKLPPRTDAPGENGFRKGLRFAGTLFPPFLLWAMMAVLFTGFVFARITDTSPAQKITICADAELQNAPELAARLEREMAAPIRMVKIHSFSYFLFGSDALRGADLYIVPASRAEEYREWFASPPPDFAGLESSDLPGGIPVFDPSGKVRIAADYILYQEEPYYLFFGANSVHRTDGAAAAAARALLGLSE